MKKTQKEQGIIKLVILIIVTLLVLSYFGISIRGLVNNPVTQDNISYTTTTTVTVWDTYLKVPATYLWKEVFIDLIWNPAIDNLKNLRDNQPSTIQQAAPTVPQPPAIPQ